LSKYDGKHDAMTFRLVDAYGGSDILLGDTEWLDAITFGKGHDIVIDLGELFPADGTMLAGLAISQTAGSVYVNSIEFANADMVEVPEPTTLAMLGAGCLVFIRKKKA
jgi:hypothetical protein